VTCADRFRARSSQYFSQSSHSPAPSAADSYVHHYLLDFDSLLSCLCCSWVVVHKPLIELNLTEFYDCFSILCGVLLLPVWISQGQCCINKNEDDDVFHNGFVTTNPLREHYWLDRSSECSQTVLNLICAGTRSDRWGILYTSSAGVVVWSSVWHAVLHTGHTYNVDKHHVDIDGVQWQRDIQWADNGVCVRLQVSRVYRRRFLLPTKGTFLVTTRVVYNRLPSGSRTKAFDRLQLIWGCKLLYLVTQKFTHHRCIFVQENTCLIDGNCYLDGEITLEIPLKRCKAPQNVARCPRSVGVPGQNHQRVGILWLNIYGRKLMFISKAVTICLQLDFFFAEAIKMAVLFWT